MGVGNIRKYFFSVFVLFSLGCQGLRCLGVRPARRPPDLHSPVASYSSRRFLQPFPRILRWGWSRVVARAVSARRCSMTYLCPNNYPPVGQRYGTAPCQKRPK